MAIDKFYKSVDEMIDLQQNDRHLIIKNRNRLETILTNTNYFDLFNGFETLLLVNEDDKSEGYQSGVTSNDFVRLYSFDKELNKRVLKTLGELEISLKTKIAHYFSSLNSNSNPPHINYLDKNYYRCPASTSYNGVLLNRAFNNDGFILFRKYQLNNGKYYRNNTGIHSYVDYAKSNASYLGRYNNPPLWVLVKQLTFGDTLIMSGLLEKDVMDLILTDYHLSTGDREFLLNCLDVFKQLRNHCAHFELVNRFRTSGSLNLKIINNKILLNHKSPVNSSGDIYRIPLYDTLKILSKFVSIDSIIDYIVWFYYKLLFMNKLTIARRLIERMGSQSILDWKMLKR